MNASAHIRETTVSQRLAADPALSAIVTANAGAGKTRVLTNRVARLLLEGVDPSSILCITFTKAAAAEMAERLFKLLGDWALADNAKLSSELAELDGDAARRRSDEALARARRLFAQALETPGGLKIQTIHSFCESLLKRFPLEAGVPPGFTVIDEMEATRLVADAVDETAARRLRDPSLNKAFTRLLAEMNGSDLEALLRRCAASRRLFESAAAIGWPGLLQEAHAALGVRAGDTAESLLKGIADLRPRATFERARKGLDETGGNPQKHCAAPISAFLAAADDAERLDALSRLFLTTTGGERKKFGTGETAAIDPWIEGFLKDAQRDFLGLLARRANVDAFENTKALYVLAEAVSKAFADRKAAHASLDFDDLIALSRRLLNEPGKADWVLWKLDQGLEHILLDEAQDTSPDAWEVIERPLEEFFAGLGSASRNRTFFAVGDKKQSIYSFQGADAKLFDAKEQDLGKKIAAAAPYKNVPLRASFRTTAPVLAFVDALFAQPEVWEGVAEAAPEHHCTREGDAGLVEVWPLIRRAAKPQAGAWDAPQDQITETSPPRVLANAVADEISGWLSRGERLESQGRPIRPGDIMILVQKRKALFHEMIRALAAKGVPAAGADRVFLIEDQAVLDLLSYARAVLYEGDDLALAETLKSPFFDVSEESLFDLAHGRGPKQLWRALAERAEERPEWSRAAREIGLARRIGLGEGPAAFFLHVLETGEPSGWRRLAGRLGAPAREPVEEFLRLTLDFEAANPRSLRLFLDAILASNAQANRESAETGDTVRVLTAHKAKGLEANIVFILDAHAPPNLNKESLFGIIGPSGRAVPALAIGGGKNADALVRAAESRKRDSFEEYRRLLYVAATRARDRLYICGHQHGNEKDPQDKRAEQKTWHALALDAFDALGGAVEDAGEKFGGRARRLVSPQTVMTENRAAPGARRACEELPRWLFAAPPPEARLRRLSPSMLAPETDNAYPPGRGENAFLRGRILHRLMELLPDIAPGMRPEAARRLARRMGGEDAEALAAEAMRVIGDPQFAPVFAPGGFSEVAIGGAPRGARAGVVISGQIDRLAVDDRRVLILDYKTNRPPPVRLEDVAPGYIAQLAAYRALLHEIYPAHEIEAALLWTYDARLMPVPAGALDRAFAMTLA